MFTADQRQRLHMFKITEKPTFPAPIRFPWSDGEKTVDATFTAHFHYLTIEESQELRKRAKDVPVETEEGEDLDFLITFLKGRLAFVSDIDHDGDDESLRAFLFSYPQIVTAMWVAFNEGQKGDPETKN
jgi:hypothetical protein